MTGFTDSDFSSCPWLFSYDSNNQVSFLLIIKLGKGSGNDAGRTVGGRGLCGAAKCGEQQQAREGAG